MKRYVILTLVAILFSTAYAFGEEYYILMDKDTNINYILKKSEFNKNINNKLCEDICKKEAAGNKKCLDSCKDNLLSAFKDFCDKSCNTDANCPDFLFHGIHALTDCDPSYNEKCKCRWQKTTGKDNPELLNKIFTMGDTVYYYVYYKTGEEAVIGKYEYNLSSKIGNREYETFKIFVNPPNIFQLKFYKETRIPYSFLFVGGAKLAKDGKTYTITVTKTEKGAKKALETKINNYGTYHRFYFGFHAGVFFPIIKAVPSNEKLYPTPDANLLFYKQNSVWKPKALVLASVYPFGFEPERWNIYQPSISGKWYQPIQILFGTELSDKFFKTIDFGVGYSLSIVSINFIFDFSYLEKLRSNYKNYLILPTIMKDGRTQTKWIFSYGVSVSFPMEFWVAKFFK